MTSDVYTIITFSPVQGFIEKSRRLRDLFGSSFLISYLSKALCQLAQSQGLIVIAPGEAKPAQGVPNQIIIRGDFPEEIARNRLLAAWGEVVLTCKAFIEGENSKPYSWNRAWDAWKNHCWEFFWAQSLPGETITQARQRMNEVKRSRAWTGINWVGESSTLSGTDAIAWPGMLDRTHPTRGGLSAHELKEEISAFYDDLSLRWDEPFCEPTERLSIPELVKHWVTHPRVADLLNDRGKDFPHIPRLKGFQDLNRHDEGRYTGWFQGDGDSIGDYFREPKQKNSPDPVQFEEEKLSTFSQSMIQWGGEFEKGFDTQKLGRIIYAGGDDFLGVMYRNEPDEPVLTLQECLELWVYEFPSQWKEHGKPITVSTGFVWAAPGIPQRDILQHCHLAEKSAKKKGRDRIAIRILFNGGNHLEWTCPWRLIQPILSSYRDREQNQSKPNWGHLNEDVQTLLSRHAFEKESSEMAQTLFDIYFPECSVRDEIIPNKAEDESDPLKIWFNGAKNTRFNPEKPYFSGILGDRDSIKNPDQTFNAWFIALARIGVHLFA